MAYTINKTDGTVLVTVADGTINTAATNITLVGKNFTGYGEILNENYIRMLENFANTTAPSVPLTGQIWWNTSTGTLTVYDGTQFKAVSSSTVATSAPSGAVEGDLWWNSTDDQLYVYNSTAWVLIGPSFAAGAGTSGAIVEVIADTELTDHVTVSTYVANTRVSIATKTTDSGNALFTPKSPGITGFTTLTPGINLVATGTVPGAQFTGTASNAALLSSIAATQFLRSDAADVTNSELKIQNDALGLRVGAADDFQVNISGSNVVNVFNTVEGANMVLGTESTGAQAQITLDAVTGHILFNNKQLKNVATPTLSTDATTKAYVDTATGGGAGFALLADGTVTLKGHFTPNADSTINLGTSVLKLNNVHAVNFNGLASQASYADLAERFEADVAMTPGTIVELGGIAEITRVNDELSDDIFGVISTQPGYLMNATAGTNESHPPIAMSGRVPVRVIGTVKKGDRLVSAGNGLARAATREELTAFNVIGRALENKLFAEEGPVESIVSMNS